jgi:hypothetical protein
VNEAVHISTGEVGRIGVAQETQASAVAEGAVSIEVESIYGGRGRIEEVPKVFVSFPQDSLGPLGAFPYFVGIAPQIVLGLLAVSGGGFQNGQPITEGSNLLK